MTNRYLLKKIMKCQCDLKSCIKFDLYYIPFFKFLQISFFRQFFRSVSKADYLTMRNGFIAVSTLNFVSAKPCFPVFFF